MQPIPNNEERTMWQNLTTFDTWREHLTLLAVSSFEWDLPDTIDPVYLERELFFHGQVVVFISEGAGLVVLSGFSAAEPNLYGIPTKRRVTAKNGFTAELTNENSVIIYNNTMKRASAPTMINYAKRLSDIDNTIFLNANAQKMPFFVKATKENELSVANAFAKIENGEPVVAVTQDFEPGAIEVFNSNAPFVGNDLRALQENILAEYLRTRGIGSAKEKAERIITSEIAASNSGLEIYKQSFLTPRRLACEEINKRFGWYLEKYNQGKPVSVRFKSDTLDFLTDGRKGFQPESEVLQ